MVWQLQVTSIVSDAIKFIYVGDLSEINDFALQIPGSYSLSQNYPNPFNPSTVISYSLPSSVKSETMPTGRQEANVKLIVFDILGREVATLVNQKQNSGNYKVEFDGNEI